MKLGLVTYNLAGDWDCDTLIKRCRATGFEGVELRTTHKHGVEPTLSKAERQAVRAKFADAGITMVGLGTTCEYHSLEPDVVRKHVKDTADWVLLAKDLGINGVKVRPNGVHTDKGIPLEQTLEQIGKACGECAAYAADHGVEIRLEVHGRVTCQVPNTRRIVDVANHPNLKVCWNCNDGETADGSPLGSIKPNFDLLKKDIALVHIQDIGVPRYPWQQLVTLLKGINYQGFCLAEIQPIDQPERLMHYYRALWDSYLKLA